MPGTILVVDDSVTMRALVRSALEDDQHQVVEAADAQAALDLIPESLRYAFIDKPTLQGPRGPALAIGWCIVTLWSSSINTGLFGHAPNLPREKAVT